MHGHSLAAGIVLLVKLTVSLLTCLSQVQALG